MSKFVPTKYNLRIFEEFDDTLNNIIISATAGSGKTTQLVELFKRVPKNQDAIFLAFNKSIADELRTRLPSHVHCSTIHSFGCRTLFSHFPGIKIDENKYFKLALMLYNQSWKNQTKEKAYYYCYRISKLVELCCLTMTLESEKIETLANEYDIDILGDEIEHAIELYDAGYDNMNKMNFSDMVHQVAIRKIKLKKFDIVAVDELQDLNQAQQMIVRKLIKPGVGRLIGVGDPSQAIYGFSGADFESYDKFRTLLPNTTQLPLSICFRCPTEVIKLAKKIVPSIEAAPNAPKGKVNLVGNVDDIEGNCFVICRNTKPLVEVFKELIRDGKKAHIKGRDIGKNLASLISRSKAQTIEQLMKRLAEQRIELKEKLFRKRYPRPDEHPSMVKLIEKIDVIKILAEDNKTITALLDRIKEIFVDKIEQGVTLSTIHKIKGMEHDKVWFLNRHLIPSQYAKTEKDLIQENNLLFVALTRSKKELIFVNI